VIGEVSGLARVCNRALHDCALLGLGQAADLFELLLDLGSGAALLRRCRGQRSGIDDQSGEPGAVEHVGEFG